MKLPFIIEDIFKSHKSSAIFFFFFVTNIHTQGSVKEF